jgi:hypothetical protein
MLQTGQALGAPAHAYLTEAGQLILQRGAVVAQLDDRDLAPLLAALELDGRPLSDEALVAWLEGGAGAMALSHAGVRLPVERMASAQLAERCGFVKQPAP